MPSQFESLVLDGLSLNDGTVLSLESLTMPPPAKRPEWVSGADSDGAVLFRDPFHDNRIIEARIRVEQQATKDLALAKIALIVDKLEECERNLERGLALVWTPADATTSPITFRCLSGEITEMPIDVENGWMVRAPMVTLRLTCLPFGEGAETLVSTVTSSVPIVTLELSGVAGDMPATGRLVVTDAAAKDRRYVAWGLESRYYPTSSPPSLIVDSASMTTGTGYAGATATRTAAYGGATNNVISAILRTYPQAVCGLGNLSHVGTFRPQLRYYALQTTLALRLTYKTLDGPYRSLSYKVPVSAGFNHIDLGLITIPATALGTQRWTGQIEAYSTLSGGETFQVDALWLMPAELYGRARGTYAYGPGGLVALDQFGSIAAGTVLNARTATVGGTWATSGEAPDLTAADAPLSTDETITRAGANDSSSYFGGRLAVLGATNYTNVEVTVDGYVDAVYGATGFTGVVARYVDASNYIRADWRPGASGGLKVNKVIAGIVTNLSPSGAGLGTSTVVAWRTVRLVIFDSGFGYASVSYTASGEAIAKFSFYDSSLATGGTLATGKPGIYDHSGTVTATTRYYDNFYAAVPPAEPIVCYSGQSIEFRHDDTLREDSSGTYAGNPPEYIGARFIVPPAGGPGRKARVAVIARRLDIESTIDDDLTSNATTDSTTVDAYVTPRYLAVPR